MKPHADPVTLSKRASKVVLATLLMVAVSGYFMGLNQTRGTHGPRTEPAAPDAAIASIAGPGSPHRSSASAGGMPEKSASTPAIVAYSKLGDAAIRPNTAWRSSLATLAATAPFVAPARTPAQAVEDRARAVERRRSRRAFEGAPPVIPHPVDPTSPASCSACHETGLAIRDLVAPRMSHGNLGLCTQCHVPAGGGLPEAPVLAAVVADNAFRGLSSPGAGSRAWPGAPPTIPHTLHLRETCASCHGPNGLPGLRTTHPERTLCTQCHVPEPGGSVFPWTPPAPAQLTLR